MAAESGRSDPTVIDALRAAPQRFEFVQAVRLLERAAAAAARDPRFTAPGLIGADNDPRTEALRLRAVMEMAFPATEIVGLDESGGKPALTVAMMGLSGVSGVLPGHYARLLLEALRDKNTAPRDFLDMFNHRALSLFVRAAEKYRLPLLYERARVRGSDAISGLLLALVGMRGPALEHRQALPDSALIFYAGHFSQRLRTADALRQMLSEHFDRPVGIKQFQGHWADLMRDEQTRLGAAAGASPGYATLGTSAVLGARIWDVQGSFRIQLGPLDYAQFQTFMPGAAQMAQLAALTRSYVGPALDFDVQLTLKGSQVPACALSSNPATGARLGWNSWLPTTSPRRDASDAIFRADAA
ncbi:MAG TPA: type VI secretion system baseplate subunit TssG [Steroidobacteraceae bacterium]|nr:type VI secretion system baseplate subunit TssG [Steroidobacteraceae bacterium]